MGTASAVSRRAWRRSSAPKWGRREGPAGEWRDQGVTQQGVTRLGSLHEECSADGQVDQEGAGVGVLDPGRTDLARTVGPGPDADHEHIRVPMQGEERLPEGLAQLILAGDPERLVLLHGVQSPFGGAVEPEQTVAVAGDHR